MSGLGSGLVGAIVVLVLVAGPSAASARSKAGGAGTGAGACASGERDTELWWSPRVPVASAPLRLMAVSESRRELEISVMGPDGRTRTLTGVARGGPPFSVAAELDRASAGTYQVTALERGRPVACRRVRVEARAPAPPPHAAGAPVWPVERAWDQSAENLYSAWIERLFDAPVEQTLEVRPLHVLLRDPGRNFLYGHRGLREDDPKNKSAIVAKPDCADLPYLLRAYFAWKLGLPFGFRDCDRGTDARPPRCGTLTTNEQPAEGKDALSSLRIFLRQVMNKVQSGSARTALADEETDYYPVKLERQALRPGVVYADPYGHVLVVAKWIPQSQNKGGLLLAVDGQPDTSIARKRFWEGTFLFTNETKSAGPGFKAFRPLVRAGAGQPLGAVPNKSLTGRDGRAPFSLEQARLGSEEFYARLGKMINPRGLDAVQAYNETLDALVEQLQTRVGSVDNGEKYMREGRPPVVPMPEGPKIFETTGPWEDYATPSRDMRLLIAMKVLLGLPERVVRHPELFSLGGRKAAEVKAELEALHARRAGERAIEYRRSDGSPWKLTVADLLARRPSLEMAYNPNDCVELRWGAKQGTPEHATCARFAPDDQRARMSEYRTWFREARRPPR